MCPNEKEKGGSLSSAIAVGNLCRLNRIQHANSLEPSVPCHSLSSIVNVLNEQISLLLVRTTSNPVCFQIALHSFFSLK